MKLERDTALTTILIFCALVTTGLVVRREFFIPVSDSARPVHHNPVFISDWRSDLAYGVRLGSAAAPVQVIEFSDFECPFCGSFHQIMKDLRNRYPSQLALVYVHYPLPGHRFALIASRVAECAGEQGQFEAMYEQLFEGQDSFGIKPWIDYAQSAGVPNIAKFEECINLTAPLPQVEKGKQLAVKLDVKATPTVVVNGWILSEPPTAESLDAMIRAILEGKNPVATNRKRS